MCTRGGPTVPANERPFDGLDPGTILDAIEEFGVRCDGRLLALNSFENRVYQIGAEDGRPVVAKFYRPDRWSDEAILEEHAFSLECSEQEIPVIAPLQDLSGRTLAAHAGFRYAVYPSVGGYWPELQTEADRVQLGRLIGRLHALGSVKPFAHRPGIDVESYGERSAEFLLDSDFLPPGIDSAYREVTKTLLECIATRYAMVPRLRSIRLHGDLHRGNILWSDQGVSIVDLDDCRTGPAIQDLWMLLAGSEHDIRMQLADFLSGYQTFYEFDVGELVLIEALRGMRMMHHAAWLARRWNDPAFPIAFPWFNTQAYWEDHLNDLREQAAKLDAPAVGIH